MDDMNATPDRIPSPWLTLAEAAAYARVHPATIERATGRGELRVGGTIGKRLFRREWLDEWLAGGGGDE